MAHPALFTTVKYSNALITISFAAIITMYCYNIVQPKLLHMCSLVMSLVCINYYLQEFN